MKQIIGCKVSGRQSSGSLERANELKSFFNRFSSQPSVLSPTPPDPHTPSLPHMLPPLPPHSPDVSSPVQHLSSSSSSSSSSTSTQDTSTFPDSISPRMLKKCASQLSPVLQHLYNLSLGQERIPVLPAWFLCQRSRHHQTSMTTDQWPSHLT